MAGRRSTPHKRLLKSEVKLSLDEFQQLFSSAKLADAERRLLDEKKSQEEKYLKMVQDLERQRSQSWESDLREQQRQVFPQNHQVLKHTASGNFNATASSSGVEHDVASFEHELVLRVIDSRWTEIPVANMESAVASDWKLFYRSEDPQGSNDFVELDSVTSADAMMMLKDTHQVLTTNRSGLFKIQYTSFSRVTKTKNLNQIGMSDILYQMSQLTLRITNNQGQGFVKDVSLEPSAAVVHITHSTDEYTEITATLPLTTDNVQIRWLAAQDGSKEDSTKEEDGAQATNSPETTQMTASSEVLHTVDEGMIRSNFILDVETSEVSSLNSVQFLIRGQKGIRITSLEGLAFQHWDVETFNATMIRVEAHFKSSFMGSAATLILSSEQPSADLIELPRLECLDVLRQVGHVAVINDYNVEIHEHSKHGLSSCEATDVSSQLRLNLDRPIVYSYKYLSPDNSGAWPQGKGSYFDPISHYCLPL